MSELKSRMQGDLTEAIRHRDELTSATLRMALAAITEEEKSGKAERVLTDDEIIRVLTREAKKRRDAADIYAANNAAPRAERELAEVGVLDAYLPTAMTPAEVDAAIADAIAQTGATTMRDMGSVMKALGATTAGRVDGKSLAAAVRAALA